MTIDRFLAEDGSVDLASLPPRIRQRIEKMPERRRLPALEALFKDRRPGEQVDGQADGRTDKTADTGASPARQTKPAPGIEAVDVPEPPPAN